MMFKKRKRANKNKDGVLWFPRTVNFEVDQYTEIEKMKIPDVGKSFGAKVRYLLDYAIRAMCRELVDEKIRKSAEDKARHDAVKDAIIKERESR